MQKRQQNRSIDWRMMLAVWGVFLFLLVGCDRKKETAKPPPPPSVEIAEVSQGTVPIVMEFSGTLKAVKTVDIIPRVSGYINERYFQEGTFVKKGDPLYLIDPRPFKAQMDSYTAQLESDKAALAFCKSEAARYTKLAAQGAASQEKKESAVTQLNKTIAAIAKDKATIENARLELSFTRITAPFSGRIQQTRINIGNLVQEQRDVLTTLIQMDPIYAIFNITREQAYRIQLQKRQGKVLHGKEVKAVLILPDGSDYCHQGKLDFVSFQISPTTDSVLVRAVFPNKKEKGAGFDLIPGQYAPVRLILGEQPDALLIPQPALMESQAGQQVFVVNQENKVESRMVDVSSSYKHQWVIKKGLKKGEKVIVEGVQKVRPGMVVKPETAASQKD